jgi:hypothetical protein
MEDLNLDIDGVNEAPKKRKTKENVEVSSKNSSQIANLNVHEIAKVFTEFKKDNRIAVIPIGFPQAGKSLMISSLMHYARKCEDVLFKTTLENNSIFSSGRVVVDSMVDLFGKPDSLIGSTEAGTLDLIGINIKPTNIKLPNLNLGFLDLAGEDIKNIKTSEGSTFTDKINAIFNGLKIDNTPIIFLLITPFEPAVLDGETIQDAHDREDTLHYDFLNYIEVSQPQLLRNSKFFIIVSQWDKNPNDKDNVEDFIREYRPSIYGFVKNSPVVWGEYSVGQILVSNVNGINFSSLVRRNIVYPSRFWKKLYTVCTGKNLDQKTWLEKLFG